MSRYVCEFLQLLVRTFKLLNGRLQVLVHLSESLLGFPESHKFLLRRDVVYDSLAPIGRAAHVLGNTGEDCHIYAVATGSLQRQFPALNTPLLQLPEELLSCI